MKELRSTALLNLIHAVWLIYCWMPALFTHWREKKKGRRIDLVKRVFDARMPLGEEAFGNNKNVSQIVPGFKVCI